MKVRVLGCDPSLNNFGLVKATIDTDTFEVNIVDLNLSKPPKADSATKKQVRKNSDDLRRAKFQADALRAAVSDATIVIVEVPVGSQSARAMASYGICIGVLAGIHDTAIIQVTPSEVKLTAVGTKTASKQEMIDWAVEKHPEANWLTRKLKGEIKMTNDNEHLADAVAAIYAGMETDQFKGMVSMFRGLSA